MTDGFLTVAAGTPEIRVADCAHNAGQIIRLMREAAAAGVKVLCLPELCITGYTCGDLFLQSALLDGAEEALARILRETEDLALVCALGLPYRYSGKLFNCAAVIQAGHILGLVPKINVPNYTEFYEARWFTSGRALGETDFCVPLCGQQPEFSTGLLFRCEGMPSLAIGVEICEDLWVPDTPSTRLAQGGATLILNLSASDEVVCKDSYRRNLVTCTSGRLVCGYIYADAGQGESSTDLIYGGHSLIAENGALLAERRFATGLTVAQLDLEKLVHERQRMSTFPAGAPDIYPQHFALNRVEEPLTRAVAPNPFVPADHGDRAARCREILTLAALGLRKRLEHTRAKTAVIGLSGGLDSTLALLITKIALCDLLGRPASDILAVTMPCFGTTARTKSNAVLLAEELGASLRTVDIGEAVRVHFRDIGQAMDDLSVTFENGQARERTQVLMDLANKTGGLVIGTGDLSELALGWATYNGDHMSMYAVNASIPKTLVRHLVAYVRDERRAAGQGRLADVLEDILNTPVSPELLPAVDGEISQKTEDLVGPYELHDFFLYYAVRWGFRPRKVLRLAEHAFQGRYGREYLLRWLENFYRRFFAQQFKRSCLPDGPKVGTVTLSPRGDWRMPSDACAALWMDEVRALRAGET